MDFRSVSQFSDPIAVLLTALAPIERVVIYHYQQPSVFGLLLR